MNQVKKVVGINLIILLVYTIIYGIGGMMESGQYKGMGAMIMMMMAVGAHVGILLLISIIRFASKNKESGRAFLLSGLLVLLVGFSACWGVASLF
jgi:hypothetical protein